MGTPRRDKARAYRLAAQLIAKNHPTGGTMGCCLALRVAGSQLGVDWGTSTYAPDHPFQAVFRPYNDYGYWWPLKARKLRVMALLFAAAMAETGDL